MRIISHRTLSMARGQRIYAVLHSFPPPNSFDGIVGANTMFFYIAEERL